MTEFLELIIGLFLIGVFLAVAGYGFANVIDTISWYLHYFAIKTRKEHKNREVILNKRWDEKSESS